MDKVDIPDLSHIQNQKLQVVVDGFVRLVDWMGDGSVIVQAARVPMVRVRGRFPKIVA